MGKGVVFSYLVYYRGLARSGKSHSLSFITLFVGIYKICSYADRTDYCNNMNNKAMNFERNPLIDACSLGLRHSWQTNCNRRSKMDPLFRDEIKHKIRLFKIKKQRWGCFCSYHPLQGPSTIPPPSLSHLVPPN